MCDVIYCLLTVGSAKEKWKILRVNQTSVSSGKSPADELNHRISSFNNLFKYLDSYLFARTNKVLISGLSSAHFHFLNSLIFALQHWRKIKSSPSLNVSVTLSCIYPWYCSFHAAKQVARTSIFIFFSSFLFPFSEFYYRTSITSDDAYLIKRAEQVRSTWQLACLTGTALVFLSDVAGLANPSAGINAVVSDAFAQTCNGV